MCVPCAKEIINHGSTAAAESAVKMRKLVVGQAEKEGRPLTEREEAFLLRLAGEEVRFILAMRRCRTAMIEAQEGSREWVHLALALETGAVPEEVPARTARPPSTTNPGQLSED